MAKVTLRDYQEDALKTVCHEFENGCNKQLVVLPTGTGKTVIMAAIIKHFNKNVLVLAHREELITQAQNNFKRYWPEADIGICRAEENDLDHQIVIASVPTCSRDNRLKQLKEKGFDLLIIDEAHHAAASTYKKVVTELGFNDKAKLLVGFTATPERNDNKGLLDVFDKIVFTRSIQSMISEGYLCPVHGRKIITNASLQGVRTQYGDFAPGELATNVNTNERNKLIVEKYQQHASGRKAVAFCVDVKHAKSLSDTFNANKIKTAAVLGDMPMSDRKKILQDFKDGKIIVVTSCGVLTEGFDEPSVNCIVMARPTKSRSLYIQAIGRGLRLDQNKKDCLVLDFLDKYHNLDSIVSLSATIPGVEYKECEKEKTSSSVKIYAHPKIGKKTEVTDKPLDMFHQERLTWVNIDDREFSLADDDNTNEIIIRPLSDGFIADLITNTTTRSIVATPMAWGECKKRAEDYARQNLKIRYAMQEAWKNNRSATDSQKNFLKKRNIDCRTMNINQAARAIRTEIARDRKRHRNAKKEHITPQQQVFLQKAGIEFENLSKYEAMTKISTIKQQQQGVGY